MPRPGTRAMGRREAALAFAAAALLAAAAGPARANKDEDGPAPRVAPLGRPVAATTDGRQVLLSAVILAGPGELRGIGITAPVPQFDENRVALGALGLGGLTRPTLAERVERAVPAGRVLLSGRYLIVVPDGRPLPMPSVVTIAHQDRSWDLKGPPGRVRDRVAASLPALGDIPVVGRAFTERRNGRTTLLVLVRPTLVRVP